MGSDAGVIWCMGSDWGEFLCLGSYRQAHDSLDPMGASKGGRQDPTTSCTSHQIRRGPAPPV